MRSRSMSRSIAVAAVFALAACGGQRRLSDPGEGSAGPTVLQVENHSTLDMNVYAIPASGARQRLGLATSLITSYFEIPDRLLLGVTNLSFQASPIGATTTRFSEQITVIPGDTVVITLPR